MNALQNDEPVLNSDTEVAPGQSSPPAELEKVIRNLLKRQPFCVLCTQGEEQPYGSLIAFGFSEDLKHLYFTTPKATRKFKLLTGCHRVAFLVDSRCEHPTDMKKVEAVTITAKAEHLTSGPGVEEGKALLRKRHPYLDEFLDSDSTALFRASVIRYIYVTRFQEVSQWIP